MIQFNPDFARQYGVTEAIVFERLKIIQLRNKDNFQNYYFDTYWVDFNYKIYSQFFYFIKESEVEYALDNLIKQEIIKCHIREHITYYSIYQKYINIY